MMSINTRWIKYLAILGGILAPLVWAIDSTDSRVLVTTFSPNSIFILETGYISFPNIAGYPGNVVTSKRCPTTFSPYMTMIPSKIKYVGSNRVPSSWGICVQNLTLVGSTYSVNYLPMFRYGTKTDTNTAGKFVGTNPNAWTAFDTVAMPNSSSVSATEQGWDLNSVGGIYWTLYCYPPGVAPPNNAQDCAQFTNPF